MLTVTAISLGLISNVWIALNDVPNQAKKELRELLDIQEQMAGYSVKDLLSEYADKCKNFYNAKADS
jgi:hypothetical protein